MKLLKQKKADHEINMEKAILDAAEELFLQNGFASTSTTQIARKAGCNQALVHYYFRTKENLFNNIFENKFKNFFQQIFDMNNLEGLPFIEKVQKFTESHFDLIRQNPKLPHLIIYELTKQPERVKVLKSKLQTIPNQLSKELHKELELEIERGKIKKIDLFDLLISIISLNIALFAFLPVITNILEIDDNQREALIEHRKEENVNIILNYLKP